MIRKNLKEKKAHILPSRTYSACGPPVEKHYYMVLHNKNFSFVNRSQRISTQKVRLTGWECG